MICPVCSIKGTLKETRRREEGTVRRYHCEAGHKWKTIEQLELVYDNTYTKAVRVAQAKKLVAARIKAKENYGA